MKFLLQCPCTGGNGIHPVLLLAIVAGIWLLAGWMKRVLKKKGDTLMNKIAKIVIVVFLIAAVIIVIAVKQNKSGQEAAATADVAYAGKVATEQGHTENQPAQLVGKGLPALIDLGAGQCIPCKMMAPILEELKSEYEGTLIVEFIDVWKKPDEATKYDIKLIPTQIFLDASGKELFRHESFFSKEDILSKWKEFGIEVTKTK